MKRNRHQSRKPLKPRPAQEKNHNMGEEEIVVDKALVHYARLQATYDWTPKDCEYWHCLNPEDNSGLIEVGNDVVWIRWSVHHFTISDDSMLQLIKETQLRKHVKFVDRATEILI